MLVARVFSTPLEYGPSWEKEPDGKIKGKIALSYKAPSAWTVMSLFTQEDFCDSGTHRLPLFKGAPSDSVMKQFAEKGVTVEVREGRKTTSTEQLSDPAVHDVQGPGRPSLLPQGTRHPQPHPLGRSLL